MPARRTSFYLDRANRRWSGVCAGLADYIGLDVTIVRVGVVLLTFMSGPWTIPAYFLAAWLAEDRPREFAAADRETERFWQHTRANPRTSIRDIRGRFRDIDRRLAGIETHVTAGNGRLAAEIEALRCAERIPAGDVR